MKLRIFISWSGHRSRAFAKALHDWLPHVLHYVEPWMSSDLQKGVRWMDVIGAKLAAHDLGLICVTPENAR